jgi:hypothetical protein
MTLSTNKRRPIIIGPDTPLDPKETDLWVNTTNNKIYRYDGSTFAVVSEAITQAYVQSASAYALSQATSQVNAVIDAAPGALNTLNELAAALNDDANFATTIVNQINNASAANIYYTDFRVDSASGALTGYIDAELGYLETTINNNISLSEVELVGIINTASVANTNYTDSEIIALNLTAGLVSASAAAVSYADALTTTDVSEGTSLYFTNQRAIDAGSATYLTQSNAATTYLPQVGGVITGNLEIDGTLIVSGSTAYINVTEFKVDDPMIYLAGNSSANLVDIGLVGNYNDGSYAHTGLVKDATDGRWKFFSSVETEPTGTIAFNEAVLDAVAMGSASVIGNVNASAFIGDGSQLTGINLATKADKLNTFDSETSNYTLILSNADQIVEMNVGSANTLTVPPNSSVAFPVGTELTVLQTNTGQTTITPGAGVTINGTPGLKLRAQWASAVLIKRAENTWVAIGDLSA